MNEIETRYTDGAFAARNPEFIAQQALPLSKLDEVTETMRSIGSGILGSIPAGIAGAAALPFKGPEGATQLVQDLQGLLTYIPQDEKAQAMVQRVGSALEMLGVPAQWVGNQLFEGLNASGSETVKALAPAAGAAGETLLDPLNLVGAAVGAPAIKAATKVAGKAAQNVAGKMGEWASRLVGDKIKLTGTEFGENLSGKELRKAAMDFGRENFVDKSFTNTNTNDNIIVPWQGVKHALSNANDPEVRVFYALPDLLKQAEYVGKEAQKGARKDVVAVHKYSTTAYLGDEPLNVGLVVFERADGHKFYDHFIINESPPAGISGPTPRKTGASGDQPAAGGKSSVITSIANDKASGKNPARKADE